ncbi:hypothetical protein PUN28_020185 [Cardiocondyla obscurior]|uniref:Uncharacterized protein n=1 Tax=Cardiocondyla obscurior TaxID=286306 RepID=A0AAW2EAU2_9HYME
MDQLKHSVRRLNRVLDQFPIGAISLDDSQPIEEKIQEAKKSLMRLNARWLILKAKHKQYIDAGQSHRANDDEAEEDMQSVISNTLINTKAIKLCLHSTTILSILNDKEGDEEDQKKLYTYMKKLFLLNDNVIAIQKTIEEESQVQLNLSFDCQKALFDYKNFLKEQEQLQSEKMQKTYPEIAKNKDKVEIMIRKINIMKKLIRNFVATSSNMIEDEPILLQSLEKHRELISVETIMKLSHINEERE